MAHAATAYGIVLSERGGQRLGVRAEFRRGNGVLIAEGALTASVRLVLYAVMEAVTSLESYIDGLSSDKFGTHDLHVTMHGTNLPVDGESYGLPLAMAIVASMLKQDLSPRTCFTGVIEPAGHILPVENIDRKRRVAAALGFTKIVLPSRQLDMFNAEINQCPVDSIYGAVSGYFWE